MFLTLQTSNTQSNQIFPIFVMVLMSLFSASNVLAQEPIDVQPESTNIVGQRIDQSQATDFVDGMQKLQTGSTQGEISTAKEKEEWSELQQSSCGQCTVGGFLGRYVSGICIPCAF